MLDIGFTELLLVAVIAIVVLGPERLPQAIRTTTYWIGKIRRSFQSIKEELEKEVDVDGIKQQLHNEAVMKELNKTREQFQSQINDLKQSVGGIDSSYNDDQSSLEPSAHINQEPSAQINKEPSAQMEQEPSAQNQKEPQNLIDTVDHQPSSIKKKP